MDKQIIQEYINHFIKAPQKFKISAWHYLLEQYLEKDFAYPALQISHTQENIIRLGDNGETVFNKLVSTKSKTKTIEYLIGIYGTR